MTEGQKHSKQTKLLWWQRGKNTANRQNCCDDRETKTQPTDKTVVMTEGQKHSQQTKLLSCWTHSCANPSTPYPTPLTQVCVCVIHVCICMYVVVVSVSTVTAKCSSRCRKWPHNKSPLLYLKDWTQDPTKKNPTGGLSQQSLLSMKVSQVTHLPLNKHLFFLHSKKKVSMLSIDKWSLSSRSVAEITSP